MLSHLLKRLALRLLSVGMICIATTGNVPAWADSGVVGLLIGTWSGNGRVEYTDGTRENISCNAYYNGGGNDLSMVIRCRSENNPIHIRSRLRVANGRISGQWEERTFNATGTASGTATGSSLQLAITGGGFAGTMSISIGRASQSVTISTEGIAMRRATLSFRKTRSGEARPGSTPREAETRFGAHASFDAETERSVLLAIAPCAPALPVNAVRATRSG